MRNFRAHLGVLYSYSGFTEPAIEKAKKLLPPIECCRLFASQPAELPGMLRFQGFYCDPAAGLFVRPSQDTTGWENTTWRIAFDTSAHDTKVAINPHWAVTFNVGQGIEARTILDEIALWFEAAEASAAEANNGRGFPASCEFDFTVPETPSRSRLNCTAWLPWRVFRVRVELPLLNGSYSYTRNSFHGDIKPQPFVWPPQPEGGDWEEVDKLPTEGGWIKFVPRGYNGREVFLLQFGSRFVLEPKCCQPPSWGSNASPQTLDPPAND